MAFLAWIERTGLSTWVRESGSIWSYPTVLFLHTVGLGLVVGVNAVIDLRLLGVAPRLPIAPMAKLYPVIWLGFWVNAVSGILLLMADATTKLVNPVFYIKMSCIVLAVAMVVLRRRLVFRRPTLDQAPLPVSARFVALVSLVCWAGAVAAGRLMAYLGPVSGLPGLENTIGP